MNYLIADHTDQGIVKKVNQDSYLAMIAETDAGLVVLAVLCDGMGGLALGELASKTMVLNFKEWFSRELPLLIAQTRSGPTQFKDLLKNSWDDLVRITSVQIRKYGVDHQLTLGTTCVAILMFEDNYYLLNVGDSRAYLLSDKVYQLTKDQTYVQQEVDAGRMSYEESLTNDKRNLLLQCIGAGNLPKPDYYFGRIAPEQCYLLCCDGFRHVVNSDEFFEHLKPTLATSEGAIKEELTYLTQLNKQRKETDNITALLIKTYA